MFSGFRPEHGGAGGAHRALRRRPEKKLHQQAELFDEAERYWDEAFRKNSLVSFVETFTSEAFLAKMSEHTWVAVLLMDSNLLTVVAAMWRPWAICSSASATRSGWKFSNDTIAGHYIFASTNKGEQQNANLYNPKYDGTEITVQLQPGNVFLLMISPYVSYSYGGDITVNFHFASDGSEEFEPSEPKDPESLWSWERPISSPARLTSTPSPPMAVWNSPWAAFTTVLAPGSTPGTTAPRSRLPLTASP